MDDGKMTQTKVMRSPAFWPDFKNSGMGSPTELWMLNTLEFPSAGVASSLSDTLETGDVPQRFFLSARACRGILRRAEKRGKTLPPPLAHALMAVADLEPTSISTAALSPAHLAQEKETEGGEIT
jgi:hypothetical protein